MNVLERPKLPQVVAGIPSGSGSIEGQCEFHQFRGLDLSGSEPLFRMVGLPCGHKGRDVGFRVRTICIPGIWVRHGVEIRVFW